MATQYDEIAERYNKIKSAFIIKRHFHITVYTLQRLLGNLSGKSVLDLACGEGLYTRQLKLMGASRVVGVDVSERMLSSARKQEANNPLGIEYIHSAIQNLAKSVSLMRSSVSFFCITLQQRSNFLKCAKQHMIT